MSSRSFDYTTLNEWLAHESVSFSADSDASFAAAVDAVLAKLGDDVTLLGLGEPLHFGADVLRFRNRLFRYLVEAHGFRSIALESSFPRGRMAEAYVAGGGAHLLDEVLEAGFSHGFGRHRANRELIEWMRQYNDDPAHPVKLRIYGFDGPTEMTHADSPRQVFRFVLDYLDSAGHAANRREPEARRERIESLLGDDANWENPAAMMDPSKSVGLSPAAAELRLETENLVTELAIRAPELVAGDDEDAADRYGEALRHAVVARWLLHYHATLAQPSPDRTARLLGMRDALMADNLAYVAAREAARGRTLAYAHNMHLRRSPARWQLGPELLEWWPAGAHLEVAFGPRYAVIGAAIGMSEAHGIGRPEPGTLEAMLMTAPGPVRFIPTHRGKGLPAKDIQAVVKRSGSGKNFTYFPLSAESIADFDGLLAWDSIE
jgi:erythromycin esterase-like protein